MGKKKRLELRREIEQLQREFPPPHVGGVQRVVGRFSDDCVLQTAHRRKLPVDAGNLRINLEQAVYLKKMAMQQNTTVLECIRRIVNHYFKLGPNKVFNEHPDVDAELFQQEYDSSDKSTTPAQYLNLYMKKKYNKTTQSFYHYTKQPKTRNNKSNQSPPLAILYREQRKRKPTVTQPPIVPIT